MAPDRTHQLRPESSEPLVAFALTRLLLVVALAVALVAFDMPHRDRLLVLVLAVALPWSLIVYASARRGSWLSLSGATAVVDLVLLAGAQLAAPGSYAAIRFLALFLIAAHAHFRGEWRAFAVAAGACALLIPMTAIAGAPVHGDLRAFYETLFAVAVLGVGLFVGRLHTTEAAQRVRARELSRRAIEAENDVRRRVAESIHDGPVQELVSLDIMLAAAQRSLTRGDVARSIETIDEARHLAERNVGALRQEIVGLGPFAFDELSFGAAIEQCVPVWSPRYGIEIDLQVESLDLPNDVCGAFFGIAQEAVINAGRHSGATDVRVRLARVGEAAVLTVSDNGRGFTGSAPLAPREPGHIGLASMRERAELQNGTLSIESSEDGTTVTARIPLPVAARRGDPEAAPSLGPESEQAPLRS